jgi:hypothetical protein
MPESSTLLASAPATWPRSCHGIAGLREAHEMLCCLHPTEPDISSDMLMITAVAGKELLAVT